MAKRLATRRGVVLRRRDRGAVTLESAIGLSIVLMFGTAAAQALMLAHAQVRTHAAAAAAARALLAFADSAGDERVPMAQRMREAAIVEVVPASPRAAFWGGSLFAGPWTSMLERAVWAAQATSVHACTIADANADFARVRVDVDFAAPIVMPGPAAWFADAPRPPQASVQPAFTASLGVFTLPWEQSARALAAAWPQIATARVHAARSMAWPADGRSGLQPC